MSPTDRFVDPEGTDMPAIHVVVPAYNPGEIVTAVIERASNHADTVVIVDDGCDASRTGRTWNAARVTPMSR